MPEHRRNKVVAEQKLSIIEAQCVAKGMRMTEQRRIIARVLAGAADHPHVEELIRRCALIDDERSGSACPSCPAFSAAC